MKNCVTNTVKYEPANNHSTNDGCPARIQYIVGVFVVMS